MDRGTLHKALEEALAACPPETAPSYALSIMMRDAVSCPEKADPRFVRLLEEIRKQPDLEIFNGKMQVLPDQAARTEYQNLASWLLRRASSNGPNVAVADLDRYVEAAELPCTLTLALTGITTDIPREVGHDIHLVPWDSLPYSSQKQSIHERTFFGHTFHMPTCAVIRAFTTPKRHLNATSEVTELPHFPDDTELHDAVRCLGLVRPSALQVIAEWVALPEWVPFLGGSMSLFHIEGFTSNHALSDTDYQQVRELLHRFFNHHAAFRAHLRVPTDRLNRAMRRTTPVDAFIDLGIALESLYLADLEDDRGELTFRLRLRAARFLRTATEDRTTVFDLVGDIYRFRSMAVHTGKVDDTVRGRPVQELLQDGSSLTADTIRRFILCGEPDWKNIILQ
jgi:hypothetical protein